MRDVLRSYAISCGLSKLGPRLRHGRGSFGEAIVFELFEWPKQLVRKPFVAIFRASQYKIRNILPIGPCNMISEVPNGKKPPDFYREMYTVEAVVTRGFTRPDSSVPGYLVQSKWDDNVRLR